MSSLPPPPLPPGVSVTWPPGIAPPDFRVKQNDLSDAWHELQKQAGPVARRRLNRATFYRARLKRIVAL